MVYSVSSGVISNATVSTRSATMIPTRAVPTEILLSGKIAPTPMTVNRYFTKSNRRVESFSRSFMMSSSRSR